MTTKHQYRHCEKRQIPDEAIWVVKKEQIATIATQSLAAFGSTQ
jgi:hypothetical protein